MAAQRADKHDFVRAAFHELMRAYGPQDWWPADTADETAIGAVLTQNTTWTNVEKAIENLRRADALTLERLVALGADRIEVLVRSAGTFRVKTRRLLALASAALAAGGLHAMLHGDPVDVRRRLLAVNGIGPETADAIMLYAGGLPTFVVDAYARRVWRRHRVIGAHDAYDEVQRLAHEALPRDAAMFNEYHALLVELGKRHCRARALCDGCPLANDPHDEGA